MQQDFIENQRIHLNQQIDYLDINMPLNKKGQELLKKLIRQYGFKKGKSIFYAMEKKKKVKSVKKKTTRA